LLAPLLSFVLCYSAFEKDIGPPANQRPSPPLNEPTLRCWAAVGEEVAKPQYQKLKSAKCKILQKQRYLVLNILKFDR